MTDSKKYSWEEYYEATSKLPPSELLIDAVAYLDQPGRALDLGADALKDSKYLLDIGFEVTAVDSDESFDKYSKKLGSSKLHTVTSKFEDYDFPKNYFDLVNAMNSLSFVDRNTFDAILPKILKSIKPDGIICGNIFGINDSWSKRPGMTFTTMAMVEKILSGLEIIYLDEEEKDSKTALGTKKHWHIINFIARKS